ncbi:hypothetical protein BU23DRAFT_549211 [Bimuria novae-zelandiae CBS 107.79]|uniref:Uncharacterized protein n=1 Tax=Bimuria novae-zelandiae CBS 107.79 TaxID=1447943 RepID=A0A6A5VN88_9PLEO|nr:hypothetical protein BU23DRAFT_549211 [Bimuria novae-zelandiae CBS 107.79]
MAYAEGTRRSARVAAKQKAVVPPKAQPSTPIRKPRTTRNNPSPSPSKSLVDLDAIETRVSAQEVKKPRPQRPRIRTSIVDIPRPKPRLLEESTPENSSADEFDMEDNSSESSDEFNEEVELIHDHFEYIAAHDLQRTQRDHRNRYSTQSYDSRLEPGNETYEFDDFVAADDESVTEVTEGSDDDLDLAIDMERDPVRASYISIGTPVRTSSLFSSLESQSQGRRHSSVSNSHSRSPASQACKSIASLTSSQRRRRSSSALFVTELTGDPSIPQRLTSWTDLGFPSSPSSQFSPAPSLEAPLIAQASANVVEEIVDALALFSRRVNRDRPPVRLRLAAAVLEDAEIREALQDAISRGLGRNMSLQLYDILTNTSFYFFLTLQTCIFHTCDVEKEC